MRAARSLCWPGGKAGSAKRKANQWAKATAAHNELELGHLRSACRQIKAERNGNSPP